MPKTNRVHGFPFPIWVKVAHKLGYQRDKKLYLSNGILRTTFQTSCDDESLNAPEEVRVMFQKDWCKIQGIFKYAIAELNKDTENRYGRNK